MYEDCTSAAETNAQVDLVDGPTDLERRPFAHSDP